MMDRNRSKNMCARAHTHTHQLSSCWLAGWLDTPGHTIADGYRRIHGATDGPFLATHQHTPLYQWNPAVVVVLLVERWKFINILKFMKNSSGII